MSNEDIIMRFIETGELPVKLPSYPERTFENIKNRRHTAMVIAWNRMRGLLQNLGYITWKDGVMVYTDKINGLEADTLVQY